MRRLYQTHASASIDSVQQQQPQQRDSKRRRIIPSLSLTLPDGNIQPIDVSPLRGAAEDDLCDNGNLSTKFSSILRVSKNAPFLFFTTTLCNIDRFLADRTYVGPTVELMVRVVVCLSVVVCNGCIVTKPLGRR